MRFLAYISYLAIGLIALSSLPPSRIGDTTSLPLDEIHEANKFYLSLITATASGSGLLKYDFQGGQALSKIPGTLDIAWLVQPGTSASIKFEYQRSDAKSWKKLQFSFDHPIAALFRQGHADAQRQEISRIEFRPNGEPLEYYDDEGQPIGLALSHFPEIRQHLQIRGLSSLLFGIPFAGFTQSLATSANGFTVKRVLIPQDNPNALVSLTLMPASKIVLVDDGKQESWIKASDSAQITVSSLVYDKTGQTLDASLRPVKFNIAEGSLAAGQTSLTLGSGGTLSFEHLRFWSNKSDGINCLSATNGSFAGQLGQNSVVDIADEADGASLLDLGVAEPATLTGLTVQGVDDRLTIGVSKAQLPISETRGQLPFGAGNKLRVRFQNQLPLALSLAQTSWFSNQPTQIAGSIPGFTADVIGGQFFLNDRTAINLGTGLITSSGLTLNFPSAHPATGVLTKASFAIMGGTTFGLGTNKLLLKILSGTLKTSGAGGLSFSTSRVGPVGNLLFQNVAIGGGSLKLGNQGAVELESGSVDIDIKRDSTIAGKWAGKLVTSAGEIMIDGVNTYHIKRATFDIESQSLSDAVGFFGPFKSVSFSISRSQLRFSDNFTAFTADMGTELEGNDPTAPLSIQADGELTGRIHLAAPVAEGTLTLNAGSSVRLLASSLVDAVFVKESHHPLTGRIGLTLHCGHGDIRINKTTNIPITGGEIKAADLAFVEPNSLTGKLNKLELDTGPVTTVFPNALQVSSEAPGTVRAGDGVGPASGVNLGGCITFTVSQPVKAGQVKLGKNSVVNLVGGTMITTQHFFCPGGQPDSTSIALDVVISNGRLQLNKETTLNINQNSHLKADALTVSEQNGVTGSISQADLTLGESMLSIPRGFKMMVGPQSHLTATAPAQPLHIDDSGTSIYGTVVFDGPMEKFFNADPTSFQLRGGTMHFELSQQPNGRIEGHAMSLTGATMDLVITDPAMVLPVDFVLTKGEFAKNPDEDATLTATTLASISSFTIQKQTDCNGDHDDGRFFPITYSVKARQRVVLLSGNTVLKGDQYTLPGTNGTIGLTLSVAPGQGEHENEQCNGEDGWGEMAPNQEAYTAWLHVCRFHLYLAPHDYSSATAHLVVSFNGSKMSMTMSELSLNESLATDHSGCWPVGGLFEAVGAIVIQNFKLPNLTFSIEHDFHPSPSS